MHSPSSTPTPPVAHVPPATSSPPGCHHDAIGDLTPPPPPPSPSSATITNSSLTLFLHRDIRPQEGQRLLLPFFTTMDRLRLSECSQGLVNYRYHLLKVKIHQHFSPDPSIRAGLDQLLLGQERLEYLRVGHSSLLPVLRLASRGCFKRLKTLDLSDFRAVIEEEWDEDDDDIEWELGCDDVGCVADALNGGWLEGLEELDLTESTRFPQEGVDMILAALGNGACPGLRRLNLSYLDREMDVLAGALESGHLRHLQELYLQSNHLGDGGGAAIARAQQGGACPELLTLDLSHCGLSPPDSQALVEALRSGHCAKLEMLGLGDNREMGDAGFTVIFGALEAGFCPALRRLDLRYAHLSLVSATALVHALRSGPGQHLQRLDLSFAFEDRVASLAVSQAIRQVTLPHLLRLHLARACLDQEHGQVVGRAIEGGSLPELEELRLSGNVLRDGVMPVMVGLEGGGCRHLKKLEMMNVDIGPQGGQALARALASGNLSCLGRIQLASNKMVGDHAMAEVIQGLKQCPELGSVDIACTGMEEEAIVALLQGLRDGWWVNLEELCPSKEPGPGDGMIGEGLVELLGDERGSKLPRLRDLSLYKNCLTQEGADRLLGLIAGGACPKLELITIDSSLVLGRDWEEMLGGREVRIVEIG